MRITQIDIKNFRGFYGSHSIKLDREGRNAVIYGENGSGKSSLFVALKHFFQASRQDIQFTPNCFTLDNENAYIKITLLNHKNPNDQGTSYEWSVSCKSLQEREDIHHECSVVQQDNKDQKISAIAKLSGFLDYRDLLNTHLLHPYGEEVNIFDILINVLFISIENEVTSHTFGEDWLAIQALLKKIKKRRDKSSLEELAEQVDKFYSGLASKLPALQSKFNDIFGFFNYPALQIKFKFPRFQYNHFQKDLEVPQIILKVSFFEKVISHQQFLNEAKLSAIGLSIYLAALLLNPPINPKELQILVLDDVLIGLDMSNRLSVVKILKEHFSSYQIFLLTHDREWFEILNHYLKDGEKKDDEKNNKTEHSWKFLEFYAPKDVEFEIPIFEEKKEYLTKARYHYSNSDYKAAAVYLRSAFEEMIKKFCDEDNTLKVNYHRNSSEYNTADFWDVVKTASNKQNILYVSEELARQVESIRKILLNPLSHAQIKSVHSSEMRDALIILEKLKQALSRGRAVG